MPLVYANREVLFRNGQPGFKSDIWSMAATLSQVKLDIHKDHNTEQAIQCMEQFICPAPRWFRAHATEPLLLYSSRQCDGDESVPLKADKLRVRLRKSSNVHRLGKKLGSEQLDWGREPNPRDPTGETQRELGRLVLHDKGKSRYISNAFWTKLNDEVCCSDRLVTTC